MSWDDIKQGDCGQPICKLTASEYNALVAYIKALPDGSTYILKTLFNEDTILKADTDDTPVALTLDEQRILGRITGQDIAGLTAAQVRTLINVEDGATKYPDTGEQAFLDADHTKLNGIESGADVTDAVNVASSIHGVAAKATPVNADEVGLIDSAAANVLKKLTWTNLKATLKTYFDTLYNNYSHPTARQCSTGNWAWGSISGKPATYPPDAHTLASHSTKAHSELTGIGSSDHHVLYSHPSAPPCRAATSLLTGHATAAQIAKLNGIETGATADQTKADIDALGIDAATLDSLDSLDFIKKDGTVAMTGDFDMGASAIKAKQIYKNAANSFLALQGGNVQPAYIALFGSTHVSYPGYIQLMVPNAAKDTYLTALEIIGATDTPTIHLLYNLDVNGKDIILDADADTKIESVADDVMYFHTGGVARFSIVNTAILCGFATIPWTTSAIALGDTSYKWSDIWAVTTHFGDLGFTETTCPKCNNKFKLGDNIILKVIRFDEEDSGIMTIPIHAECADLPPKTFTKKYAIKEDYYVWDDFKGEKVKRKRNKLISKPITKKKLKEDYKVNETTGDFWKLKWQLKEGYTYDKTTDKYYDLENNEVKKHEATDKEKDKKATIKEATEEVQEEIQEVVYEEKEFII